jgi:hypothetical protein
MILQGADIVLLGLDGAALDSASVAEVEEIDLTAYMWG